jgi:CrcB protein
MLNTIILVFVGGSVGALVREFFMLGVPKLQDGFPLDIFLANLVASLLLGCISALHARKLVSDSVHTLVATGIMGGLSTFSSFVYGAVVVASGSLTAAGIAAFYVLSSIVLGYGAVLLGLRLGGGHRPRRPVTGERRGKLHALSRRVNPGR